MEYTTSEIVLAVIIVGIVIFGIFCLIDLIPDDVNDSLDKKERFEKTKEKNMIVEVICDCIKCENNENGYCSVENLVINRDGECMSYDGDRIPT